MLYKNHLIQLFLLRIASPLPFEESKWKALYRPYSWIVWSLLPIAVLLVSFTNHLVLIIRQFPLVAKDERQHGNSIISDRVTTPANGRQQGQKHARQPQVDVQKITKPADGTEYKRWALPSNFLNH